MNIRTVFGVLSMLFWACTLNAQDTLYQYAWWEPFEWQFRFQVGVPSYEYRQAGQSTAVGFGSSMLVPVGRYPLRAGLDVSWMRYSRTAINYNEIVQFIEYRYREQTSNNSFMSLGMLRYEAPVPWFFTPYAEGLFGLHALYTRTSLTDRDTDETLFSQSESREWLLSYGGSVGAKIWLFKDDRASIDLRASWLHGNAADFYVRDPDRPDILQEPIEAFKLVNSRTNLFLFQIGFVGYIWKGSVSATEFDTYQDSYDDDL